MNLADFVIGISGAALPPGTTAVVVSIQERTPSQSFVMPAARTLENIESVKPARTLNLQRRSIFWKYRCL